MDQTVGITAAQDPRPFCRTTHEHVRVEMKQAADFVWHQYGLHLEEQKVAPQSQMPAVRLVEHPSVFAITQIANQMLAAIHLPLRISCRQLRNRECLADTQEHF